MNLKQNPFLLEDEAIEWVTQTLNSMTDKEKIGQLFCTLGATDTPETLGYFTQTVGIGGTMYRPGKAENVQETHRFLQSHSKIPMLLAANLEAGGNGAAIEGTCFAKPLGAAAAGEEEGYVLGKIACSEGAALGLNWAFAPIVDIDMNYRNPITNLRTFGSNIQRIVEMAKGYMKAADEEGIAVSIKHFPGDGVDERDQHLLTSVNSLSCQEWDETYGYVYKSLIDAGAKTVMVGHIAQPAYQKALADSPEDYENKTIPATLSKELMTGLLREKLGFNGLIVTDASQMLGFTTAEKRQYAVPQTIACGADMLLFNKDFAEDYKYMFEGYEKGIITKERLDEAVTRILALKASLKLHKKQKADKLVPEKDALFILGCEQHRQMAQACADKAVTLVKDTAELLPLSSQKYKHVYLNVLESSGTENSSLKEMLRQKLEGEGFSVTVRNRDVNVDVMAALSGQSNDPHALELLKEVFGGTEAFSEKHDLVIYAANFETASNNVVIRLQWQGLMGMGDDAPWFVKEVPALFISFANPYHLIDVPMIQTFINAYTNNSETIDAVIEKIMGRSTFKGNSPVDASCGRKDTLY